MWFNQIRSVRLFRMILGSLFLIPLHHSGNLFAQWKEMAALGGRGTLAGQFSSPHAISSDPDGNLFIADTENHRIQKLNSRGTVLKAVGGYGWQNDQFNLPMDISAQSSLNIFVTDFQNHRIQRYDKDLNYLSSLESPSNGATDLTFTFPVGIVLTGRGDLFVSDVDNNRIIKINLFGKPEFSFGSFDAGRGKLSKPGQIEWSKKGDRLFVCDTKGSRIVVFDYFGNFNRNIGEDKILNPAGIFVENDDMIWICEPPKNQITCFNFRSEKVDSILVSHPADLTKTAAGYWILSDNTLKLFSKNNP